MNMSDMEVSIVLPVYNGEETIQDCLSSIKEIDYSKSEYEVIVVNDGSKDNTKEIVERIVEEFEKSRIRIKIIDFNENRGRIEARIAGAEKANFDNLLFIDHRCLAASNILKKIEEKNYEPIIGNLYQRPEDSIISRFFYVFRSVLYRPYFGKKYPEVLINKENFSKVSKGFSPFFCRRTTFFENLPEEKSKWVNDDTLIFANIVKEKEILKTSEVVCTYRERSTFREFLWHLYHRGPRFVDFYMHIRSKYVLLILAILLLPVLCLSALFFLKLWLLVAILSFILLSAGTLLLLGFSSKDIFSVIVVGPLVLLSFGAGVYTGVFRKIFIKKN